MTKIVLVETISTFRHVYAIELDDNDPAEYALDDVTMACTNSADFGLEDFAQKHIAEDIFSHRVVSEEEYLRVFDETNDYLKHFTVEQKKKYIYRTQKSEEIDFGPDVGKELIAPWEC